MHLKGGFGFSRVAGGTDGCMPGNNCNVAWCAGVDDFSGFLLKATHFSSAWPA
jgi:hypothetical protein